VTEATKQYYPEVTGWKGIFALCIVLLHVEATIFNDQRYFETCFLAVDAFFMMSGFLFAKSIANTSPENISPFPYVLNRIRKIYPIYIISLLLLIVFICCTGGVESIISNYYSIVVEALMLQMTGIFPPGVLNVPDWYVSSLFISLLALLVILKHYPKAFKITIVFAPIALYSYIARIGTLDVHFSRSTFTFDGNLRAVAGICLGILIYQLIDSGCIKKFPKLAVLFVELILLSILANLLFRNTHSMQNFYFLFVFPILLVLNITQCTVLNVILNSSILKWLGNLSLHIFLIHMLTLRAFIYFSQKVFGTAEIGSRISTVLIVLALSIIFAWLCKIIIDKTGAYIKHHSHFAS